MSTEQAEVWGFMVLMVSTHAFKWFPFDLKSSISEIPVLLTLTNQRLTSPPSFPYFSLSSLFPFTPQIAVENK